MSKGKLGFSFLTTFALMLIFSVAALAAAVGVTIKSAAVDEDGLLKVVWTPDVAATDYTVTVKDLTANADKTADATINKTSQTITLATNTSTKYEFTIVTVGGANAGGKTVLNVFTPASNKELVSANLDNGIPNANKTGLNVTVNDGTKVGDVIKSKDMVKNDGTKANHRTHGEYQNNTNSCASCHQTHTGASKSLLFKDGVYNTCTACHDGTLGFYNVFEPSNAGTFGGTHQGNMSVHLADGSVQIKAAPGGNGAANTGSWVNEFNCASCHSPHGSYSDRLLHYNPNGMGLAKKADGGIGIKGGTVYSVGSLPATTITENFIAVKGKAKDFGLATADIGNADINTTTVITVYEKSGSTWVKSNTPWLYGYSYGTPKNYYTSFYKTVPTGKGQKDSVDDGKGGKDFVYIADFHDNELGNSEINFSKGFIYSKTDYLDDVLTADVGRAYAVDLDLQEIAKFGSSTAGVPIYKSNVNSLFDGTRAGTGVQMSNYCAACHTDYLAKSGSASGTFSQAYRHTTNSDSYTCVRCHYAHGTDVTVMMDSHGKKLDELTTEFGDAAKAKDYLLDKNPSSALKRYTNMSVCWGCHTDSKAEQLKNTTSFGDDNDPHGLEAQPVVPGVITAPASEVTKP